MTTKTKFDYTKINLYDFLEIQSDATDKEVIRAYRKKALQYHPDKNSDPAAVEIFHKLSKALEILTDAAAKAAYDQILKAREAAELRHKQLDSKRQKLKDDLLAREEASAREQHKRTQNVKNLEAEIARLRKEGSTLLEREQALLKEEIRKQTAARQQEQSTRDSSMTPPRIRLRWKCSKSDDSNGGYSKELLSRIFTRYGKVSEVVISSKKKGSAVLEFKESSPLLSQAVYEGGLDTAPLTVAWMSGEPTSSSGNVPSPQAEQSAQTTLTSNPEMIGGDLVSDKDFEDLVLMRMRQAEERKRLIEQMLKDDQKDETGS